SGAGPSARADQCRPDARVRCADGARAGALSRTAHAPRRIERRAGAAGRRPAQTRLPRSQSTIAVQPSMREKVMRRAARRIRNAIIEGREALGRYAGLAFAAALAAIWMPIEQAGAQGYPARPITVIVPYPAGGPADAVGRIMIEGMRKSLGQAVVI